MSDSSDNYSAADPDEQDNIFLAWWRAPREDQWANRVEFCGWFLVVFSLLSQLSYYSPGYNFGLGLFALYCEYSRNRKAVFTFTALLPFSLVVDVAIAATYGGDVSDSYYREGASAGGAHNFGLGLLVLNMMVKVVTLACACRLHRKLRARSGAGPRSGDRQRGRWGFGSRGGEWSSRAGSAASSVSNPLVVRDRRGLDTSSVGDRAWRRSDAVELQRLHEATAEAQAGY
jgi:hypothetical protein